MPKYQPYPKYKESEVDMLGHIPTTWNVSQVRFLLMDGAEGIKIGPFGSALKLEDMVEDGIRVYGQENVIKKDFSLGKRKISEDKFSEMQVYQIYPKDLLITMMGTSGKCELVPNDIETGIIDSHLLRVRVNQLLIVPELFRLLIEESHEIKCQIEISGKGSIMHGLNSSIVKSLKLPLPNIKEQEEILSFLNIETTRIDTLIQKKTRFIGLLKEKRQALISHAVTKGLVPKVSLKDSNVDWMGNIPEHWGIKKIKHLFKIEKRIIGHDQCQVLSITQHGIKVKDITSGEGQLSMDYSKYQIVNIGDFAMNHMDLLTGYVDISQFNGVTSPDYRVFQLIDKSSVDQYYLYLMQMGYTNKIFFGQGQGVATVGRWRFQTEPFKNFPLPYPPINEQQEIVVFINKQTAKIDGLTQRTQQSIALLKEHRTALISAAVTGKIDVRNHAGSTSNNLEVA